MLLESENKKSRHVLIAEGTGSRGESLVRAFTARGATTAYSVGIDIRKRWN